MSRLSLGRIYFLLCFVAFAVALCVSSSPPLFRDYPDWVYQGALLAKVIAGHPVAGYAIKHYPVPNSVTTIGIALLTLVVGWLWAAKMWMLVYLVAAIATAMRLSRSFQFAEWVWWVVPPALFLGQALWFGTVSFNLGMCAVLLLADALYRGKAKTGTTIAWLVLCFFLHLVAYAAAGLLLLLYCAEHRTWRMVALYAATLPLPMWYFLARSMTHGTELAGASPPTSHLAVPVLFTMLFLALATKWNSAKLSLWSVRVLLAVSACLLLPIAASHLVHMHALHSAQLLAWRKLLSPLQFFGFVNIIYFPSDLPLLSATLHLFGRPLFLLLAALDVLCGIALLAAIAVPLLQQRWTSANSSSLARVPVFLRNFIALFGMLYFVSPPNALGVISVDQRFAQLAVAVGLLVVAGRAAYMKGVQRAVICSVSAVLLCSSLYQVVLSQKYGELQGIDVAGLPSQVARFGAVDPTAASEEYDRLRSGHLQGFIFPTGMLYMTEPWTQSDARGR